MNKSMYRVMLDLAGGDLLQRVLSEFEETKTLKACPSYAELRDFCKALNLVALWSGVPKTTPKKLVQFAYEQRALNTPSPWARGQKMNP